MNILYRSALVIMRCWYVVGLLKEGSHGTLTDDHSSRIVSGVHSRSSKSLFNLSKLGEVSETEKQQWEQHVYRIFATARGSIYV